VLSMAYRLTDRVEYRDRCIREMNAASAFSDWNPSHFLDVAEMTLALAIGYDWLYHDLDDKTRQIVAEAIREKGLRTSQKKAGWWVKATNNWGQVCHAGMLAGALALMDNDEQLAAEIIYRAIVNLPISMHALAPKGSYPEGPGYWSYGVTFNVLAIDLLEKIFSSDFGLAKLPGFAETCEYLDIVTGPSGLTFNYSDGDSGRGSQAALWWYAKRYNRPDILLFFERQAFLRYCENRKDISGNRFFPFCLLWLQELPSNLSIRTPLNWFSDGEVPITIHRTSWDDPDALFVGFKAGSPSASHGHMDAGSFVLDAGGVRWAYDLGSENYHNIESRGMKLWDSGQNSDRWRVFRLNNLSHNLVVVDNQLQVAKGKALIKEFQERPKPRTVLDLSPVYANVAKYVTRSGTLLSNCEFRIDDMLEGLKPGAKVRWGMVTKANPEPEINGCMILSENGKQLRLKALNNETNWQTYEVAKPPNEWDSPNQGYVMVGFETVAPESGKVELSVLFTLITPATKSP